MVYRGGATVGIRPNARGRGQLGRARNLTSIWPGLESSALPCTSCGNLGSLLTYLSLTVSPWEIRTPSSTLGRNCQVSIKHQLQRLWTGLCRHFLWGSLPQPARQSLLLTSFCTWGNKTQGVGSVPETSRVTSHWAEMSTLSPDCRVWYKLLSYIKGLASSQQGRRNRTMLISTRLHLLHSAGKVIPVALTASRSHWSDLSQLLVESPPLPSLLRLLITRSTAGKRFSSAKDYSAPVNGSSHYRQWQQKPLAATQALTQFGPSLLLRV